MTFDLMSVEPTTLELYVDGRRIQEDNQDIWYSGETRINVTCVISGGHPVPHIGYPIFPDTDSQTSVDRDCRDLPSDLPEFLPKRTCVGIVKHEHYLVNRRTSGMPVGCFARSQLTGREVLSGSVYPRISGGTKRSTFL